ncbi:MAG TPA: HD domain-containing protein [Verrucomicrobiae bacterium]|nr:HD domain-containing protein [Verrucomicrobiae bacterium]
MFSSIAPFSGPRISTGDPLAVAAAVQAVYQAMFPAGDGNFVPRAFHWAADCFAGRYDDYQAVDAPYHNFEHTLQGTLCLARMLRGRDAAGARPVLPQRLVELALLAILLHDTGYLKKRGDTEGTGAKYTLTHVTRSAEFAARLLAENGFAANEIVSVQNMIRCTGVDASPAAIPFQSEVEKIAGQMLGAADLLGQMAADNYLEKLPALHAEFAEAAQFSSSSSSFIARFASVEDLLRRTPDFWEKYVKPRLEREFGGVHRFLNDPWPDGPNAYLDQIERHLRRLREILATEEGTKRFLEKHRAGG